jgi:plasmid stabilization system protein ParE
MAYRIHIAKPALEEIDDAYRWYLERTTHADHWLEGLHETIRSLSENPQRCRIHRSARVFGRDIRQLLYKRYAIVFEIREDTVAVLHVRHAARKPLEKTGE